MILILRGGENYRIQTAGYTAGEPITDSVGTVSRTAEVLKTLHPLAVVEVKRRIHSGVTELKLRHQETEYLILDRSERTVHRLQGAPKGYAGEGPRAALTLETYFDLLDIPVTRSYLHPTFRRSNDNPQFITTQEPRVPHYTLEHLARAKKAFLELNGAGFEGLTEDTTLDEMLRLVDFRANGHF